ncbi:MAG TPA: hypothetical protein VIP11_14095 [Gemmatimonadaceae bacterium]
MHDVDRTQQFMEAGLQELPGYEMGAYEAGQYEGSPYEVGNYETGMNEAGPFEAGPFETGQYEAGQYEFPGEIVGESLRDPMTGEINVNAEIALAAELLGVSNEDELNQFLGKLVRGIGRGFKNFARSGLGSTLVGALRPLAKAALPTIGGALGSLIPIPGVGTAIGAAAGRALGSALEVQGMSAEDRDFEIARRFIRTAIHTAGHLDTLPAGEVAMEDELWDAVKAIGGKLLPGAVSLLTSGITGGAAAGAQGTGGLSGGLSVRSPGGWQVNVGGQAGGQVTSGATVGLGQPAPPVPFQPSSPSQVLPRPYQSGPVRPANGSGGGGGRVIPPGPHTSGRWIRRGRSIVLLGVY